MEGDKKAWGGRSPKRDDDVVQGATVWILPWLGLESTAYVRGPRQPLSLPGWEKMGVGGGD